MAVLKGGRMMKRIRIESALSCLCLLLALAAFAAPGYHVIKKLPLGGEGGWDGLAVDSAARRLYVSRSSHVLVIDLATDQVIGDIAGAAGVHGIALAPELNRGFACNKKDDSAALFDLKTFTVVGKVKTGKAPDAIVYDPATQRVFTFNGGSRDATVITAASGQVCGTIALGGRPESAAADGRGKIYVNIKDTNEVVEIDSRNLAVSRRFSIRPGEKPLGLALDVEHHRVFSGCRNQLMTVLDTESGQVIAAVPIGAGVDGNAFDPESGLVFSANGWDGTLTVAQETSPGKIEVVETVPTQLGARTLALDPLTHVLYLPTAQLGPLPEAAPGGHRSHPPIIKDTFVILAVGK
jgi:DNA-binding beta-propeller fold protein YncE